MNVFAGVIFFQDASLLEQSLKALKVCGFTTIAIDGAFQEFLKYDKTGKQKVYSTDGSIEVAKKLADIYIPCPPQGWADQAQKRTVYFKTCPVNSYCFVIDTDEIMNPCKIDPSKLTEDVYKIRAIARHGDTIRGYKIYPDLEYLYRHCYIYRTLKHNPRVLLSGIVTMDHARINLTRPLALDMEGKPITIVHREDLKTVERKEQNRLYVAGRKEQELKK